MLEAQFEAVRITSGKTKFNAIVAILGERYLKQVEYIVLAGDGTIRAAQERTHQKTSRFRKYESAGVARGRRNGG